MESFVIRSKVQVYVGRTQGDEGRSIQEDFQVKIEKIVFQIANQNCFSSPIIQLLDKKHRKLRLHSIGRD